MYPCRLGSWRGRGRAAEFLASFVLWLPTLFSHDGRSAASQGGCLPFPRVKAVRTISAQLQNLAEPVMRWWDYIPDSRLIAEEARKQFVFSWSVGHDQHCFVSPTSALFTPRKSTLNENRCTIVYHQETCRKCIWWILLFPVLTGLTLYSSSRVGDAVWKSLGLVSQWLLAIHV